MKTNVTKVQRTQVEIVITAKDVREMVHVPNHAEVYVRSLEEFGVEERLPLDDLRQIVVKYIE